MIYILQSFCLLITSPRSDPLHDDTPLKTLHMKRLQVHSTAQLRAAPQTDSIPPAVMPQALTSNSAAFPAFLRQALSPTSLRSGSFSPNSTSSPAASFPSVMMPFGSASFAASIFGGHGIRPFGGNVTAASASQISSASAATAAADAPSPSRTDFTAAIAATSSRPAQFPPSLTASPATQTTSSAPLSFGFGSPAAHLFGSAALTSFGSGSAALPFTKGLSFPSAAFNAFPSTGFSFHSGSGGSALFGGSHSTVNPFSFPASSQPFSAANSTTPPPAFQQHSLFVTSTASTVHTLPLTQASCDQVAAGQASTSTSQSSAAMKPEDAMEFLECVRDRFADMPFLYNTFLAVMRDFKSQSINTQDVIRRVKQLFEGHPDLVDGFNMFLPPAFRLQVDWSDTEKKRGGLKAQQFSTSYEPAHALTIHH